MEDDHVSFRPDCGRIASDLGAKTLHDVRIACQLGAQPVMCPLKSLTHLHSLVLSKLLGDYVEGLDRGQLQVAVWQGNVELENLTIRRNALSAFIPLDIKEGRIDRLKIEIPWSQLYSKPVKITMDGLSIVAIPQVAEGYNAEAEAESAAVNNARELDDVHGTQMQSDDDAEGGGDDGGDGRASLIEQIVNNLQLVIENVDVRFVDNVSRRHQPVVMGLRLRSVRMVPTNSDWEPAFNSQNERVAYRVLDISELVLFWIDGETGGQRGAGAQAVALDAPVEKHLVDPITACAKLQRVNAESVTTRDPRMHLTVEVSDIAMRATSSQLERLLAMQLFFISCRARATEHRTRFEFWRWHRPLQRPRTCAAEWWRYAMRATAISRQRGEARMFLCWDAVAKRRDTRIEYVTLWVRHKTTMPATENTTADALAALERRLSLFDIVQFRSYGDARVASDPELAELNRIVREAQAKASQKSWSEWAGTYFAIVPAKPAAGADKGLVWANTGGTPSKDDQAVAFIEATLVLASGSLTLIETISDASSRDAITRPISRVDFVRLEVGFSGAFGFSSMACSVSLRELTWHDVVNPRTRFPYLLRKKQRKFEEDPSHASPAEHDGDSLFDANVAYTAATHGPEFSVRVTSRPLEVVYNAIAVQKVVDFFAAVGEGAQEFASQESARDCRPSSMTPHVEVDDSVPSIFAGLSRVRLDLDLSAPEILVPDHFERATARLVVLDLGRLRISSHGAVSPLVRRPESSGSGYSDEDDEFLTPLSTPGEPIDHSDLKRDGQVTDELAAAAARLAVGAASEILLDPPPDDVQPIASFDISLTQIQILALRADMDWKSVLQRKSSNAHAILEPLSIMCTIEFFNHSADPETPGLTRAPMVRLATVLPELSLDLSEEKMRCLMLCRGKGYVADIEPADLVTASDDLDQSSFIDQVVPSRDTIRNVDVEISLSINSMSAQLNAGDPVDVMPLVHVQVGGVKSSVTQTRERQKAAFTVETIEMTDQFLDFQGFRPQYQKMVSASGCDQNAFIEMEYSHSTTLPGETQVSPHEIALHMNTLEVNVNQVTCAALIDLFNGTFENAESNDPAEVTVPVNDTSPASGGDVSFVFDAAEVQVTLLTKLRPFTVFTLKTVKAQFDASPTKSSLSGTLGIVDITDLTAAGAMCQACFTTNVTEEALSFSLIQHRLSDCTQERAETEGDAVTFDREFTLRLASARILYTQRFFSELQTYIGDFREFQEFFYLARQTAADLIIEPQGNTSATKMDILVDRPVLIIPENSFSTHAFEANLGRMWIRNSIESAPPVQECDADDTPTTECSLGINSIKVDIEDMNLFSSSELVPATFNGPRDPRVERAMQRIVESCSVFVQWDMRLDPRRWDLPANRCVVAVSDVDIFLTKKQYGLLLCVLNENLGSEPWMKFGLHEFGLSRGAETPSRLRPTDLNPGKSQIANLEKAMYNQVSDGNLSSTWDGGRSESGASQTDEGAPRDSRLRPEFYGSVNFKNVGMAIFFDGNDASEPEPLARLDLIDTTISYSSSSDGHPDSFTSQITWESKSIRVHDTQHLCGGVKNAFTEVLKPVVTGDDAGAPSLLLFTLKSAPKCATVTVLLNQTRIIVALPWVVKMWDWLLQWPATDVVTQYYIDLEHGNEFKPTDGLDSKEEDVTEMISRPRVWKYKISVTDPEFVVVDNRSRPDTHAVVMKFCAVLAYTVTPRGVNLSESMREHDTPSNKDRAHLSAALEGLEIFSCQLQKEVSTALSIVDPCNAQIESNTVFEEYGAENTDIELDFVSPGTADAYEDGSLEMRLSYSDCQLFMSILRSLQTEKDILLAKSQDGDKQDEHEYLQRLDKLTHVMGYPFVDSARALSYFHGSQVRAAIWLCRNRARVPPDDVNHSISHETLTDDAKIALLEQCGYCRDDATEALEECGEDVKRALVWLLVRDDGETTSRLNITNVSLAGARLTADGEDSALASTERESVAGGDDSYSVSQRGDLATDSEEPPDSHKFVRKLCLRAKSTRLCIIDDCADNDSPLMEFKTGTVLIGVQRAFDGYKVQTDAKVQGSVHCNYFNGALSAWEPCIEPWEVSLVGQVSEGRKRSVQLTANALCRLELNVTSALVKSLSATLRSWTQHSTETTVAERKAFVPYCLSNQTGVCMEICTLSTGVERGEQLLLEPGDQVTFDFADSHKKQRGSHHRIVHKIAMKVTGWREVTPPLPVNRAGTFVRYVEPDTPGVTPVRIVIQIKVSEGRKTIVVRAGLVVKSKLDVSVHLSLTRRDGSIRKVPEPLEPQKTFFVPLGEGSTLDFSPGPEYTPCNPGVQWRAPKAQILLLASCVPVHGTTTDASKSLRPFSCHVSISKEAFPAVPTPCPGHAITLFPPFVIESMLPCSLEFHVVGTNIGGELSPGQKQGIYEISFNDAPQFTFKLAGFEWTEPVQMTARMRNEATEQRLRFVDKNRRVLALQLRIEPPTRSNGAWSLCVYASYWMVNNTGLPLSYRQSARSTTAAGQQNDIVELCSPRPLLFSCDDETLSSVNKCQVCIGNSKWSQPVAMDVVGMALTVQVDRGDSGDKRAGAIVHDLGVDVKYAHGRFSRTKVITWMPRIVVVNATDVTLEIRVATEEKIKAFPPRCSIPYYFQAAGQRDVCLRLVQELRGWCWSSTFRMDRVGTFHAKMLDAESARVKLIAVEVKIIGAAYQAIFSDADAMPPFRLENHSLVPVLYHQVGVSTVSQIQPQSTIVYAWDDLEKEQELLLCVKDTPYSYAHTYDLRRLGAGRALAYPQDSIIIGPSGLVLGGRADPVDATCPVPLQLVARQARDTMQLWTWSRGGRLRNKAGYVLEITRSQKSTEWNVQLRKPMPSEGALKTQQWRFAEGRLWCTAPTTGESLALTCSCPQNRDGQIGDGFVATLSTEGLHRSHLTMHTIPPGSGKLNVDILADGPTRVIRIQDAERRVRIDKPIEPEAGLSPVFSPTKRGSKHPAATSTAPAWDIDLKLTMAKGVGISVIDTEELAYMSAEGIQINFESARLSRTFSFVLADVQMDNQLAQDDHHSNALCTSTDPEYQNSPALSVRVIRSRDSSGATDVYRLFEVSVKPMSLRIEELVLLRLVRLALQSQFTTMSADESFGNAQSDLALSVRHEIDDESVVLGGVTSATYFELIDLKMLKVRVSVQTCGNLEPDLVILKRELGLRSLMKFEDASLRVNEFRLERPFVNVAMLTRLIVAHYRHEVLRQAYKIVGSIDLLGNPIGIVQGVSSGVKALIKESSSGNPVSGGMSLARHITHGLADSAAKLSGSVAEGVGRASMDHEYQAARERRRSAAKDTTGHLVNAGSSLFRGIVYGLTGVVEQPIRGAQRGGVEGFISGGAKGIVGVVAKPLAGVFDMLSETSAAVRQSSSKPVYRATRVRPPRVIGPDRTLHAYNVADAEGQRLMLRLNKHNSEERFVNMTKLEPLTDDGSIDGESAALITSERVIFLGRVSTGETGVTTEVWFCGLYNYNVVRRKQVVALDFHVSEDMMFEIRDKLEMNPQTACAIAEPWWEKGKSTMFRFSVPCGNEGIAKTVLRHIEWAMAFFTERSHEAR